MEEVTAEPRRQHGRKWGDPSGGSCCKTGNDGGADRVGFREEMVVEGFLGGD